MDLRRKVEKRREEKRRDEKRREEKRAQGGRKNQDGHRSDLCRSQSVSKEKEQSAVSGQQSLLS